MRTRDRLHFVDTDASCVFCPDHEESHNHLFFACSWTSLLWSKVKSWLRLYRGMATISSAVRGLNIRDAKRFLRDFRFYSTWYCTFMSAIILKFLWADRIGGCSGCSLLGDAVFSSVYSPYSHCFWANRIGCCCFSWSFAVLHDAHVCHSL